MSHVLKNIQVFVTAVALMASFSLFAINTAHASVESGMMGQTLNRIERILKDLQLALIKQPTVAGATSVSSNCADLIATVKAATAQTVVQLTENCGPVSFSGINPTEPVTIDASGRVITDLVIGNSQNLIFKGGTYQSSKGIGPGSPNYAISLKTGTKNIEFDGVTVELARMGIALSQVEDLTVKNSTFRKLRSDGISGLINGLSVEGTTFTESTPIKTTCTIPGKAVVNGLSKAQCTAEGGTWKDGDHADAVQVWSAGGFQSGNVVIRNSTVYGETQGFTSFGPPNERIKNFTVENSDIGTLGFPNLGPTNVDGKVVIRNNKIWRLPNSKNLNPSIDLRGSENSNLTICGNDIPGRHRNTPIVYTEPCGQTPTPTPPPVTTPPTPTTPPVVTPPAPTPITPPNDTPPTTKPPKTVTPPVVTLPKPVAINTPAPVELKRAPKVETIKIISNLNVRSAPNGTVQKIQPINTQGTVRSEVTVEGKRWLEVEFTDGTIGFVSAAFTNKVSSETEIKKQIKSLLEQIKELQKLLAKLK